MRKKTKVIIAILLGWQFYCVPLMIAEPVSGIGSDEFFQEHNALVLDSLNLQEPPSAPPGTLSMVTTFYSRIFHGRRTSNGEIYDRLKLTCAHKDLPFNTYLKVTNPKTEKSVVVRVNDRGPFKRGRQLDLSYAAAKEIGILSRGVATLDVQIVKPEEETETANR